MQRLACVCAVVASLLGTATGCERDKGTQPARQPNADAASRATIAGLVCPVGIGLDGLGPALMPMADADCPPEVVLFGMGANGCAATGDCSLPCEVSVVSFGKTQVHRVEYSGLLPTSLELLSEDEDGKRTPAQRWTWTWKDDQLVRVQREQVQRHTREVTDIRYSNAGRTATFETGASTIVLVRDDAGRIARHSATTNAVEPKTDTRYAVAGGRVVSASGSQPMRLTYDAAGRVVEVEHGDDVVYSYEYDERGLCTGATQAMKSMEVVLAYEHDSRGRLTRVRAVHPPAGVSQTFRYDCDW